MFNFFRSQELYKELTTLKGPEDAITALAFSVHGKFLAAVGPGGVNVWNLSTQQSVVFSSSPVVNPGTSSTSSGTSATRATQPPEKGRFPALAWLYFAQRSRHVLLLGTLDGQLQIWDYIDERLAFELNRKIVNITLPVGSIGHKQVLSLDVYPREVALGSHVQIVASYTCRSVLVGTLRADGDFKQRYFTTLETGFMPKTVRFDKNGNLLVFSMYGGIITLLDVQTGYTLWRKTDAPEFMATVTLDEDCREFIACTTEGFELWDLDLMVLTKQFEQAPISLSLPKHSCFSERKAKVVGGTDRACAEVYDVRSGRLEQRLKYPHGGMVQAVAAYPTNDRFLVAMAGANGNRACDVILWYKKRAGDSRSIQEPGRSDNYHTLRIKKRYIRSMTCILCGIWIFLLQIFVIVQFSDTIRYYACHEKLGFCSPSSSLAIPTVIIPSYTKERLPSRRQTTTSRYRVVHAADEHDDETKIFLRTPSLLIDSHSLLNHRYMGTRDTASAKHKSKSSRAAARRRVATHVPLTMVLRKRNRSPVPQVQAPSLDSVGGSDPTPSRHLNSSPQMGTNLELRAATALTSDLSTRMNHTQNSASVATRSSIEESSMPTRSSTSPSASLMHHYWDTSNLAPLAQLAFNTGPGPLFQTSHTETGASTSRSFIGTSGVPTRSFTPDFLTGINRSRASTPVIRQDVVNAFRLEVDQYEARSNTAISEQVKVLNLLKVKEALVQKQLDSTEKETGDYLEVRKRNYQCPLCSDLAWGNHVLGCGHSFCVRCLNRCKAEHVRMRQQEPDTTEVLFRCPTCHSSVCAKPVHSVTIEAGVKAVAAESAVAVPPAEPLRWFL
ncbi:WD40-repeat-containing domain protein [Lentinula raphanica]|nr:WD40-repeat-containing domain protein [Lentinula raphanica]